MCPTNTILGIRLKFISPIKDQTVKEGQTARFELELSHEDVPVTWYKNDCKVHPSRTVTTHVDGKKHVLEMKEVTLDDICQIKAEAKGIPSMATLTVIGNTRSTRPSSSSLSMFVCPGPQWTHRLFVLYVICVCDLIIVWLQVCNGESPGVSPFQRETPTSQ